MTFQAPTCTCGHTVAEHQSAGTSWPHPPQYGVCHATGCDCRAFVEATRDAA